MGPSHVDVLSAAFTRAGAARRGRGCGPPGRSSGRAGNGSSPSAVISVAAFRSASKPASLAGDVVGDDHVDCFAGELGAAARDGIAGLGGKADQHRPRRRPAARAELGEDIGGSYQRAARSGPSVFSIFWPAVRRPACSPRRRPPSRRCRRAPAACVRRRRASRRALRTRTISTPAGGGSGVRARHEHDPRAAPRRFGGDRVAHAAARPVADVADGIDVLVGGTGGHDDEPAEQRARGREHALGRLGDRLGLGEPALSDPAARQVARARIDEPHAARRQRLPGSAAPPRARACSCSSPAPSAPARASPDRARSGSRRRCRWRTCR